MKRYNASVKRMADLLGEYRDLTVLRTMLLKHPERYGTYHEIRELLQLIDRQQQQLWEAAEPLGNLIFLERPKHIERRMREEWENWKRSQARHTPTVSRENEPENNAPPEETATMNGDIVCASVDRQVEKLS